MSRSSLHRPCPALHSPPTRVHRCDEHLERRLHAREHFTVNVAIAGGLLLVQEVGGGKYALDETSLFKKAT